MRQSIFNFDPRINKTLGEECKQMARQIATIIPQFNDSKSKLANSFYFISIIRFFV